MRWAGWWLGPLLGVVSAYGLLVLLVPRWLDCRHGTDAAALGIGILLEIFMTFWIVAALSGVAYALLCRVSVRVRWQAPLALAGAVALAIAVVWITVSIQEWLLEDTFCAPPWRLRWVSP